MSNSHDLIFQNNMEGNKYDVTPDKNMMNTTVKDEKDRQNWLKNYKPNVYEKMKAFPEKIENGESIAIIQFQYDYLCIMDYYNIISLITMNNLFVFVLTYLVDI